MPGPARRIDRGETDVRISQSTASFQQIKSDILTGRYAPGDKLKISSLIEELGVSQGAVREALSRLVPQNLVEVDDYRGFKVAEISEDDLIDLTNLRCEIEKIALRASLKKGDLAWEENLVAKAYRLRETPQYSKRSQKSLSLDWARHHADFHHALIAACGNERLLDLHRMLYDQAERYRGFSVRHERGRDVAHEHEEILEAALARNFRKTAALMEKHILTTTELTIKALQPEHFAAKAKPKGARK